jgi:hypothetical protein
MLASHTSTCLLEEGRIVIMLRRDPRGSVCTCCCDVISGRQRDSLLHGTSTSGAAYRYSSLKVWADALLRRRQDPCAVHPAIATICRTKEHLTTSHDNGLDVNRTKAPLLSKHCKRMITNRSHTKSAGQTADRSLGDFPSRTLRRHSGLAPHRVLLFTRNERITPSPLRAPSRCALYTHSSCQSSTYQLSSADHTRDGWT